MTLLPRGPVGTRRLALRIFARSRAYFFCTSFTAISAVASAVSNTSLAALSDSSRDRTLAAGHGSRSKLPSASAPHAPLPPSSLALFTVEERAERRRPGDVEVAVVSRDAVVVGRCTLSVRAPQVRTPGGLCGSSARSVVAGRRRVPSDVTTWRMGGTGTGRVGEDSAAPAERSCPRSSSRWNGDRTALLELSLTAEPSVRPPIAIGSLPIIALKVATFMGESVMVTLTGARGPTKAVQVDARCSFGWTGMGGPPSAACL